MNPTFDSDQDDHTYPDDNFIRLAAKQIWHDTVLLNHQSSDVTTQLSAINSAHLIAFPALLLSSKNDQLQASL